MIGIIYKFTIVAKVKFNGQTPFYIGQHWEKRSVEFFKEVSLNNQSIRYFGSGALWNSCLKRLKKQNPNNWQYFVKREILYASKDITQRGLDTLERHFIKKYKSHYSNKNGGCNILDGAANSYVFDEYAKEKLSKSLRGRIFSEEHKKRISRALKGKYVGELNAAFHRPVPDNIRKKIAKSHLGLKPSIETRLKLSYVHRKENMSQRALKSLEERRIKMIGRKLSEETKERMREAQRKRRIKENESNKSKYKKIL